MLCTSLQLAGGGAPAPLMLLACQTQNMVKVKQIHDMGAINIGNGN